MMPCVISGFRSSGMWRNVDLLLINDVSGQLIGSIFKSQPVLFHRQVVAETSVTEWRFQWHDPGKSKNITITISAEQLLATFTFRPIYPR